MKYQEMSARSLADVDRHHCLVVIPTAAVEQHGPHLPTGTDTIISTAIAEELESRLSSDILLVPTLWFGASSHHLRLGATFDLSLNHYMAVVSDLARSLLDDGFKRVLFLNGHGGNTDPLRVAVRNLQPDYLDALLMVGNYWAQSDELVESVLEGDPRQLGHACELETSLIMHLRPELVDASQLSEAGVLIPDVVEGMYLCRDLKQRTLHGFTGNPYLATAEKGKRLFDGIVEQLTQTAEHLRQQPLGTTYQDFV
ncbi:creatinine amidohydrolase [Neorhodopirellula lusitana]|uniref:Creatinine amidohydrolase n=1 Tax=Neorhodopirellula lusitana TaxID=445327 RepID=A0ABY1QJA4_9BACT|nr:creatininase family protein [Neorhodopirellula lusitana]SMP72345.1 creatinine amidohydrolase [Neorhodopirellula lusitana]